jgi:hypothetical protein
MILLRLSLKAMASDLYLSASTIKELEKCTWRYWCKKVLMLPDKGNAGSSRGSICHDIFEILLNTRHKKHYDLIMDAYTIKASPAVYRLVLSKFKKDQYLDEIDNKGNDNLELIDAMICNGLRYNFYRDGEKMYAPETYFEIKSEKPEYRFRGFIDKLTEVDDRFVITDYKSSASVFTDEELDFEIQAAAYSLWVMREYKKPSTVEFVFLRHPSDICKTVRFSSEELIGFEHYFSDWQKYIDNISEDSATLHLAGYDPYPTKNEGFKGRLVCGYPSHPKQTRKDGTTYYYCPYKFKFFYYAVYSGGALIKTFSLDEEQQMSRFLDDTMTVEKKQYAGCPAFRDLNSGLSDDWQMEDYASR